MFKVFIVTVRISHRQCCGNLEGCLNLSTAPDRISLSKMLQGELQNISLVNLNVLIPFTQRHGVHFPDPHCLTLVERWIVSCLSQSRFDSVVKDTCTIFCQEQYPREEF